MTNGIRFKALKKRRMEKGYTQQYMSKQLGVTQSQYSKIECGTINHSKYLKQLSKILDCKPQDVFSGQALKDVENEFLKDLKKETQCIYHQKNPHKVYIKAQGWFSADELSRLLIYAIDGIDDTNRS